MSDDLLDAMEFAQAVRSAQERERVLELVLGALPPEAQSIARLGGKDSLAETPYVLIWGREYDEVQTANAAGPMAPQTTRRADARVVIYSGSIHHEARTVGYIRQADRQTKRAINAAAKMLGLPVYGPTRK